MQSAETLLGLQPTLNALDTLVSFAASALEAGAEQVDEQIREARASTLGFTLTTFPRYKADPVHELICSFLDKIASGEIRKGMIFAPPQHGKSTLVSERFPAYWLGTYPDLPVILTSYGADLAKKKSRVVRQIVESSLYQQIFPGIRTKRDSRAVNAWELDGYKGGLIAAGADGPITGNGAGLGIIDDPFKSWAEAQSETTRENVWQWYGGTFLTRIWEEGRILLIMTRWHEFDLAGRLLQTEPGEWEVLRLTALAESQTDRDKNHKLMGLPLGLPDPLGRAEGEALAPRRFSQKYLEKLRASGAMTSLVWQAEYQQTPTAPEGNRFKRAWFSKVVNAVPDGCFFVRYWDKAGTQGAGKYTAGVLMAYHPPTGHYFIVDVKRQQLAYYDREQLILQTAHADRANYGYGVIIYLEKEGGSGGKESAELSIKRLNQFAAYADNPVGNGDKDVRLNPFEGQAQAGNIYLVRGPWDMTGYLDELCAIPNGKYRDQADATAGAYNKLSASHSAAEYGEAPQWLQEYFDE